MGAQDTDVGIVPFAFESVTVAAVAIGCTAATIDDATRVEATLETAQTRMRVDGTAPTSGEGHIIDVGDTVILDGTVAISNFRAIRTGATSGIMKMTYFH